MNLRMTPGTDAEWLLDERTREVDLLARAAEVICRQRGITTAEALHALDDQATSTGRNMLVVAAELVHATEAASTSPAGAASSWRHARHPAATTVGDPEAHVHH